MTEQDLWLKNEREHTEIRESLEHINDKLDNRSDIAALIINKVCLPLIISLSAVIGVDRVVSKILGV